MQSSIAIIQQELSAILGICRPQSENTNSLFYIEPKLIIAQNDEQIGTHLHIHSYDLCQKKYIEDRPDSRAYCIGLSECHCLEPIAHTSPRNPLL